MKTKSCRLHGKNDLRIEEVDVASMQDGQVRVDIARGGICGSDLHYYQDGGFGLIRVKEPIVLGHEISGVINDISDSVDHLQIGDKVAISPSQPCGDCEYCHIELYQHCLHMRFMGSAYRFPHEQGGFRQQLVTGAAQCYKVADHVSLAQAACAEPLSVCLHAFSQINNDVAGKRVLITGSGPIGLLCAALAKHFKAAEIVVTDLEDFALDLAKKMGATQTVNVAKDPAQMDPYLQQKGHFDIVFECSAAAPAIALALNAIRPRGRLVQIGVTGDLTLALNLLVSKEIHFVGTHRFHGEFATAVEMINQSEIDVTPMITASYAFSDAKIAFEQAGDRKVASKVQLIFNE